MQIIYRKAEKIYQFSTFLEEISQKCRLKYKLNELEVSQKISIIIMVILRIQVLLTKAAVSLPNYLETV